MSRRWSLAARLTVWYAASAFVLVAVVTTYLYTRLERELEKEDEQIVRDRVAEISALLRTESGVGSDLAREIGRDWQSPHGNRVLVRVVDSRGQVVGQTRDETFSFPSPATVERPDGHSRASTRNARSAVGALYLVAQARVTPSQDATALWVQAAVDRSDDEAVLSRVRLRMFAALAVTVLAAAALGYVVARRALKSVTQIADAARRVRGPEPRARIDTSTMPRELADLGESLNDMLRRLEEAFARLSRFSADIAHELRTPVNSIRGRVEVALGRARSLEEYRDTLAATLEGCVGLSALIDQLLFLARAENPETKITREPVDVTRELRAVSEFFEPAAQDAGVGLVVDAPEGLEANLDRTLLHRAVGNLVANALAHTGHGGTVTLAARLRDGAIRVEVSDTGHGISPEHLPHVFDRFYRADASRSATGAGLGLAIVRGIALLHGGNATIDSEIGRGTTVHLDLPFAGVSGSAA